MLANYEEYEQRQCFPFFSLIVTNHQSIFYHLVFCGLIIMNIRENCIKAESTAKVAAAAAAQHSIASYPIISSSPFLLICLFLPFTSTSLCMFLSLIVFFSCFSCQLFFLSTPFSLISSSLHKHLLMHASPSLYYILFCVFSSSALATEPSAKYTQTREKSLFVGAVCPYAEW